MKVIKPQRLGVLCRTYENDRRFWFAPAILAFFPFGRPERLLHEVNLWKAVGPILGNAPLDEGMPKPTSEVLVDGAAMAPGRRPVSALDVSLKIGSVDKTLYVVGDRHWKGSEPSKPEPFEEMPLGWAQAYGGEGFEANPHGKGAVDLGEGDGRFRPLPNVEDPKRPVSARDTPVAPASFTALDLMRPQRRRFEGTYDRAWQELRYPGFPADQDPRFFLLAPEDQHLAGFLQGGEAFSVRHMHPEREVVEGRLPRLLARCFVRLVDADGSRRFVEVPMHAETVRLFPNLAQGLLLYRGVIEVREDDGADVEHLVIAADDVDAPRPASHFEAALDARLDKQSGHLAMLRDRELLPASAYAGEPADDEELAGLDVYAQEGHLQQNLRRKMQKELDTLREQLEAKGIDPDDKGVPREIPEPEPVPPLEDLGDFVDQQLKEAEIQREKAERQAAEAQAAARQRAEAAGIDYDALLAERAGDQAGPPKFRAVDELDRLRQRVILGRNAGMPVERVEAQLEDPSLFEKLKAAEDQVLGAYRKFAQHFPAAARAEGDANMRLRTELMRALDAGEDLTHRDFTGIDLSGVDLSGRRLAGGFFEAANLAGANLAGADLERAVFARADLTGATVKGARCAETNFGGANLSDADLNDIDLTGGVLALATLAGTRLTGANLTKVDFMDASLAGADFSGAKGSELIFMASDLTGSRWQGCHLHRSVFIEVSGEALDFTGAHLDETAFLSSLVPRIDFSGGHLLNFRVVGECDLTGARFADVHAPSSNFRGTKLGGAVFDRAELDGSDLSSCDLQGASFVAARARQSLWVRADLRGADLTHLDAMLSIMQKAKVEGARFDGANLFRADFAYVQGDDAVRFDGANVEQVRFLRRSGGAA